MSRGGVSGKGRGYRKVVSEKNGNNVDDLNCFYSKVFWGEDGRVSEL